MSAFTIGQLAASEEVSVETVRFYQRRGLLEIPDRRGAGYRRFVDGAPVVQFVGAKPRTAIMRLIESHLPVVAG